MKRNAPISCDAVQRIPTLRRNTESDPSEKESPTVLSSHEHEQLQEYENILERGLQTFFEVGRALTAIRDARLYRCKYATFEKYCQDRWGIGRTYAWRVMGAAERLQLLPPETKLRKPSNEFQVRPFLKLRPEIFPKMWEKVLSRSKGGQITGSLIRSLISEFTDPSGATHITSPSRPNFNKRFQAGHLLVLLHSVRAEIEKNAPVKALEILNEIETLMFKP